MRVLVTLIFLSISSLLLPNQIAVAEAPKPAFASPDGRQVPGGFWQVFFTPTNLEQLSYLPNPLAPELNSFAAVLPPCSGEINACIEAVQYKSDGGPWETAQFGPDEGQRAIAYGVLDKSNEWLWIETSKFAEDIKAGRPEGSTPRLWNFSKAPHAAGLSYQVAGSFKGFAFSGNSYQLNSFNLEVTPVTRIAGTRDKCLQPSIWEEKTRGSVEGFCKTIYDFPSNLRIKVTLKLGAFLEKVQGWYDGRLKDATLMIKSDSKRIEIEGYPLDVPTAATRPLAFESIPLNYSSRPTPNVMELHKYFGVAGKPDPNSDRTLQEFITMSPDILPNALGENSIWKISSIANFASDRCLQPGILNGLVTTNATVYNSAAPTWVAESSSLDFKVAATHFDSSGGLFNGYYKMLVSEKVAQCYWGSDFTRGTASISVTNQDGSPNIATTNLGSRNGWVTFEATGFTFSAPTISAVIKNIPKVDPTPTPKSTPLSKVKKVTCIAPKKVTKIITGVNPSCPKGFKKK